MLYFDMSSIIPGINKVQIILNIKERIGLLNAFLERTEKSDQKRDGVLTCKEVNGRTYFYVNMDGKQVFLRMDGSNDLKALAQNRYLAAVRSAAKREKDQLERCLKVLEGRSKGVTDVSEVYSTLPESIKPLVDPLSISDEAYAEEWLNDKGIVTKRRRNTPDKYHNLKTANGEYVTSKSEVIIADNLRARGIPYHYEVAVTPEIQLDYSKPIYRAVGENQFVLDGYEPMPGFDPMNRDTLHPDFMVLNKRTRRHFFWEHLGLVDRDEYCRKNLNRLLRFVNAGYRIGEDVILTSETAEKPLDSHTVNMMIDKYLV